jgi:hypothetical protein
MEDDQKDGHITILWDAPVIFTRDKAFVESYAERKPAKPGDVVLLPGDAVLVRLPQVVLALAGAAPKKDDSENGEDVIR